MTGELIARLRGILQSLDCDYYFEYDEASAMNVKADAVTNDRGLIYIEEIRGGRYRVPQTRTQGYFFQKETSVSIYFCRFSKELEPYAGLGNTPASELAAATFTMTRQAIRDRIEAEAVIPFIAALNKAFGGTLRNYSVGDYTFTYPVGSRFDANEVAILLIFTLLQQTSCLNVLE